MKLSSALSRSLFAGVIGMAMTVVLAAATNRGCAYAADGFRGGGMGFHGGGGLQGGGGFANFHGIGRLHGGFGSGSSRARDGLRHGRDGHGGWGGWGPGWGSDTDVFPGTYYDAGCDFEISTYGYCPYPYEF